MAPFAGSLLSAGTTAGLLIVLFPELDNAAVVLTSELTVISEMEVLVTCVGSVASDSILVVGLMVLVDVGAVGSPVLNCPPG